MHGAADHDAVCFSGQGRYIQCTEEFAVLDQRGDAAHVLGRLPCGRGEVQQAALGEFAHQFVAQCCGHGVGGIFQFIGFAAGVGGDDGFEFLIGFGIADQ